MTIPQAKLPLQNPTLFPPNPRKRERQKRKNKNREWLIAYFVAALAIGGCSSDAQTQNTQQGSDTTTAADTNTSASDASDGSNTTNNTDNDTSTTTQDDVATTSPDTTNDADASSCEAGVCEVNMVIGGQSLRCTLVSSADQTREWQCVDEQSQVESTWVCMLDESTTEEASWSCSSEDAVGVSLEWKCVDPKRVEGNGETNWTCAPDQCPPQTTPTIGTWTEAYPFQGEACTECNISDSDFSDCHRLYVGRVDAVRGNLADLSFEKTMNGGPPSVVIRYWVLAAPMADFTCKSKTELDVYSLDVRAEGYWTPDERVLILKDVPIWPTEGEFVSATVGEQVHILLTTGGRGVEEIPTWSTRDALSFTKVDVCE